MIMSLGQCVIFKMGVQLEDSLLQFLLLPAGLTLSTRSHKEEISRQQPSPQARYVRAYIQTDQTQTHS